MQYSEVIQRIREAGVSIHLESGYLAVSPASRLTDAQRELIQRVQHYCRTAHNDMTITADAIRRLVPEGDLTGAEGVTSNELNLWAAGIALRAIQARGTVPDGWNRTSNCQQCGTVWSDHGLDVLSCGWCWMRSEGRRFSVPEPP